MAKKRKTRAQKIRTQQRRKETNALVRQIQSKESQLASYANRREGFVYNPPKTDTSKMGLKALRARARELTNFGSYGKVRANTFFTVEARGGFQGMKTVGQRIKTNISLASVTKRTPLAMRLAQDINRQKNLIGTVTQTSTTRAQHAELAYNKLYSMGYVKNKQKNYKTIWQSEIDYKSIQRDIITGNLKEKDILPTLIELRSMPEMSEIQYNYYRNEQNRTKESLTSVVGLPVTDEMLNTIEWVIQYSGLWGWVAAQPDPSEAAKIARNIQETSESNYDKMSESQFTRLQQAINGNINSPDYIMNIWKVLNDIIK